MVAEEFGRLMPQVAGLKKQLETYDARLQGFERKVESVRANMGRIGKFELAVESLCRE
jgi:prefoldin subunit 5